MRIRSLITVPATLAIAVLMLTACQQKGGSSTGTAAMVVDSVASDDGVMIYYDVRGQGDKALVFVHCWSCDRSYWQNQVDEFAKDYRVVTIDLAGHGQSGLGRTQWTMAAFGADVAAVVKKLDLEDVVLIGHSMGGPVSIEATRRLADRVVGIVGVDNFQDFRTLNTPDQIAGFVEQFRTDFPGVTSQFVRTMFPPKADTSIVEGIVRDMSAAPPEVAVNAISETITYNYRAALADVRVPIRTISSNEYPTFSDANAEIAASFKARIMPATGHFPHLLNPPMFNRLLHETLADFWP